MAKKLPTALVLMTLTACASEPTPPPPMPIVEPQTFMVFFDWDSAKLSDQSLRTIGQFADVAPKFHGRPNLEVLVDGHTDTSGTAQYNSALSLQRANAVKAQLVRDGVPAEKIVTMGRGENRLLVQTADGVREPQNRYVQIAWRIKPQPESPDLPYCRTLAAAYYTAINHPDAHLWVGGGTPIECTHPNAAIPAFEKLLTNAKVPLPPRQ